MRDRAQTFIGAGRTSAWREGKAGGCRPPAAWGSHENSDRTAIRERKARPRRYLHWRRAHQRMARRQGPRMRPARRL